MSKFLYVLSAGVMLALLPLFVSDEMLAVPLAEAANPALFPQAELALPSQISIPSIKLNSPIEPMGINEVGELEVPSGKTKNIGWYKDGTVPGEVGSAVMDAHVYAALSKLNKTHIGDDIYVVMESGVTLHFRITEKKTLPLSKVSNEELFNRAIDRELHLITCAGTFSKKLNTYTHRLLVYATLVE